jgi:myosin heavy subunit
MFQRLIKSNSLSNKNKKLPPISTYCAAVVPIQACIRRHLAVLYVDKRKRGVVSIQSEMRSWMIRRRYQRVVAGIVGIQSLYRGYSSQRIYDKYRSEAMKAVMAIQKLYRGNKSRCWMKEIQDEAMRIQCWFRRVSSRKTFRRIVIAKILQSTIRPKETMAITCIQKYVRASTCRKGYNVALKRIIACQCHFRKWRATEEANKRREEREAAKVIQAAWRGFDMRRDYVMTVGGVYKYYCCYFVTPSF